MPHLIYLAIGFPPAVKSCTYRMRETANLFCELGWDVTVVTIADESWELEFGIDRDLCKGVDQRIRMCHLALRREDLEVDVRKYDELRARHPMRWREHFRRRTLESFPELVFGSWRPALEEGALAAHSYQPADLFLVSPAPNTGLAAAWRLWREHGVPYAIDYRDAWSLNTYLGNESFAISSEAGQWESKLIEHAHAAWFVNEAIAEFYRSRYPAAADRFRVVQNGFDPFAVPVDMHRPDPSRGLTFGFLGTANFSADMLVPLIDGWRLARTRDRTLARSRLVFRGHFGTAIVRGATRHVALIEGGAFDGVMYAGPVSKRDIRDTYADWDALLLLIPGGRYVTAGKTYEYVATGMPIMSVHSVDHGAREVLAGYPLWVRPPDQLDPEALAESFIQAAQLAIDATAAQRAAAAEYALRYERRTLLRPAVRALADSVVSFPQSAAL